MAGTLPGALAREGIDISVAIPAYSFIDRRNAVDVMKLGGFSYYFLDGLDVSVILVDSGNVFEGDDVYPPEREWERFAKFSQGVAVLAAGLEFDIIHANDWHAALSLVYADKMTHDTGRVLSIHNLQYQGVFPAHIASRIQLGNKIGTDECGSINFLLEGMRKCSVLNVVSETYAQEVLTPEYGWSLDGALRDRRDMLWGITNGIDGETWNPSDDGYLTICYGPDSLDLKENNKKALAAFYGLSPELPMFGMVTRLTGQKGLDILTEAIPRITERASMIVLGKGEPDIEKRLLAIQEHNGNFRVMIGYDEAEAHRIYAGADLFVMPSRFEPCGLGQLIAMRYGTVPVVRRTGGLNDTVKDVAEGGWGILFERYNSSELVEACDRAIELFASRDEFERARKAAMAYDSSWKASARKYIEMYCSIM